MDAKKFLGLRKNDLQLDIANDHIDNDFSIHTIPSQWQASDSSIVVATRTSSPL
jgi:hypothetical protein